jgi:hypothetical protein
LRGAEERPEIGWEKHKALRTQNSRVKGARLLIPDRQSFQHNKSLASRDQKLHLTALDRGVSISRFAQ